MNDFAQLNNLASRANTKETIRLWTRLRHCFELKIVVQEEISINPFFYEYSC